MQVPKLLTPMPRNPGNVMMPVSDICICVHLYILHILMCVYVLMQSARRPTPTLFARMPTAARAWESGVPTSVPMTLATTTRNTCARHPLQVIWPRLQHSGRSFPSDLNLPGDQSDIFSMRHVAEDIRWLKQRRASLKRKWYQIESLRGHMDNLDALNEVQDASSPLHLGPVLAEAPLRKQMKTSKTAPFTTGNDLLFR